MSTAGGMRAWILAHDFGGPKGLISLSMSQSPPSTSSWKFKTAYNHTSRYKGLRR